MPYLTCIGTHGATRLNSNGLGSRGYWVFRKGSEVIVRFGPVQVVGTRPYQVKWIGSYNEKRHPCRTPQQARKRLAKILLEKTHPKHGYTRLEPGTRIRSPRAVLAR
jgi:hypothetical protein